MEKETKQIIAFYITWLIAAIILILLSASCKKKEVLPEYKIHYTAFAKVVPYSVTYTNTDMNPITEEISTNNWSKDVIVNYENYINLSIKNKALTSNDSVSISVTCGSKTDYCKAKLNNAWSNCIAGFKITK